MKLTKKIPFVKDKKKNIDKSKISSPSVNIVVKRLMGNMPVGIAEFEATQEKDNDYNLKLVNEDYDFKEDVTIETQKIIDLMKYRLDLANIKGEDADGDGKITKKDIKLLKLKAIDKKIDAQEKIVKTIRSGKIEAPVKAKSKPEDGLDDLDDEPKVPEEGKHYNIIDEEYKLQQYKALRFVVENEGDGSYEELNIDGSRQMMFLLKDGVLYPYFHGSTNVTLYPDIGSKRKIYKERQGMIDNEYLEENRTPFSGLFKNLMLIIFIILFLANMYWTMEITTDRAEFTQMVDSSAWTEVLNQAQGSYVYCAEVYTKYIGLNEEFINIGKNKLFNNTEPNTDSDSVDLQ